MKEIALCAVGAFILALIVVWIFVRANRRQKFSSAADARRRIGIEDCVVRPFPPGSTEAERKARIADMGKPLREMQARFDAAVGSRSIRESRLPVSSGSRAFRESASVTVPTPNSYLDNPILNPIHPLHSAFVSAPSYDPPAPSPTPSPSYDCPSPSPSPSYDSGSSSCDSPSPSPSSDW